MWYQTEGHKKIEVLQDENCVWHLRTSICTHDIWKVQHKVEFLNEKQLLAFVCDFFNSKKNEADENTSL